MFANQLTISECGFEIFITQDAFEEMTEFDINIAGISQRSPPCLIERVEPETMTVIPAKTSWRFEIDSDQWGMCWIRLPTTPTWNALMPAISDACPTTQAVNVFHSPHVINQERTMDQTFRQQSFAKLIRYIDTNLSAKVLQQQDRLTRAFTQVEQSLHKSWIVADLAGLTFYSEPHLYRLVKQRYGLAKMQTTGKTA